MGERNTERKRTFWRTVGVIFNFCTGLGSNRGRNVVAAYFRQVRCAGSSTGLTPSIDVASVVL